ncbi:MAG: hypothetical protein IH987_05665 [Planctomycetes bacterium]|nr:hypothetical protein [Planctomycetota bacterium]
MATTTLDFAKLIEGCLRLLVTLLPWWYDVEPLPQVIGFLVATLLLLLLPVILSRRTVDQGSSS